jgi:hypothetical protein
LHICDHLFVVVTCAQNTNSEKKKKKERAKQAVVHAAMVAWSAAIFEIPISEAIHTFAPRSLNMGGTII